MMLRPVAVAKRFAVVAELGLVARELGLMGLLIPAPSRATYGHLEKFEVPVRGRMPRHFSSA
jgi:hypothetical protein